MPFLQPRCVEGSALAGLMLPPERSPLLQELSEGRSGLEAGYYRLVHPVRKRVFLRHLHIKMHHFTKTGSGQT